MMIPTKVKIKQGRSEIMGNLEEDDPTQKAANENDADAPEISSDDEDEINTPRYWKQIAYGFFCGIMCFFIILQIEFSYSQYFGRRALMFIPLGKLMQPFIMQTMLTVLGEHLLVVPITIALVWAQFTSAMGAPTFMEYLTNFEILLIATIIERLYLGPVVQKLWPIWARRIYVLMVRIGLRQIDDDEEEEWRTKTIAQMDDQGKSTTELIEPILESQLLISAGIMAQYCIPMCYLVMQLFTEQTQITRMYGVADVNMQFYFIFACMMTVANAFLDTVIINILEMIHGWKMYDFLSFLQFRYEHRHSRWKAFEITTDTLIAMTYRTLDNMCFSSQYYVMVGTGGLGMCLTIVGWETYLRNKSMFFSDWLTLPIWIIGIFLCHFFFAPSDFRILRNSCFIFPIAMTCEEPLFFRCTSSQMYSHSSCTRLPCPRMVHQFMNIFSVVLEDLVPQDLRLESYWKICVVKSGKFWVFTN